MDKTELVKEISHLFSLNGHHVQVNVKINHREIDIVAQEQQGLTRKTVIIECADHEKPTGINKLQEDINKLSAARENLREQAILMHVSTNGYTSEAIGYARDSGLSIFTPQQLKANLVIFDNYINIISNDKLKPIILKDFQ